MKKEFKPKGYNSVSPYFIVDDAQRLINLLKELFNATELRRYDMSDGSIMHAEMKIDDSVVMLANSNELYTAITLVMHVYVPNVDELYKKAIDLGCISVEPPKQREGDPDRRATFKDFAGNLWSIGTQL